jgi:ribosomal RNA-processing protein 9
MNSNLMCRKLACDLENFDLIGTNQLTFSGHKGPVTSVAVSSDSSIIFSGSKDNSLIQWDTETGQRVLLKNPWVAGDEKQSHEGEVLAVAVSSDSKFVVCGGRDSYVRVYDTRANSEVKVFKGHRGAVTSLAFKKDSHTLFSGSEDRCLKQWDLNEMGYLETLFGHQESITSIDCWSKEQPITASNDRTIRLFKVAQQSHLVFRGHKSSVDSIQMLTDTSFISGGQDGSVCLWKETLKKPVAVCKGSHGIDLASPRWVVALGALKNSDLAVSGSYDGYLRLWHSDANASSLRNICSFPMEGFINSIVISNKVIVAGTGCEHRLGRWWKIKGNKNKVHVLKLPNSIHADYSDSQLAGRRSRTDSITTGSLGGDEEDDDDDYNDV